MLLFVILILIFFLVFLIAEDRYGKHVPVLTPPISVILQDSPRDMLRNPYLAPEREYASPEYTQIGYLQKDGRLPLFGKPKDIRRDTWYYYTIQDGIKLPIYVNKKKSTDTNGVSSVSSGDTVMVDHRPWIVELYDVNVHS
jgi:hypothetical protein